MCQHCDQVREGKASDKRERLLGEDNCEDDNQYYVSTVKSNSHVVFKNCLLKIVPQIRIDVKKECVCQVIDRKKLLLPGKQFVIVC